mmetsp:Transcript_21985/g.68861  ORF Transcript_21985/g.68861 Transcript_21985/m.68861 type:complete len:203 (-) Transcript_21985:186-794(-)
MEPAVTSRRHRQFRRPTAAATGGQPSWLGAGSLRVGASSRRRGHLRRLRWRLRPRGRPPRLHRRVRPPLPLRLHRQPTQAAAEERRVALPRVPRGGACQGPQGGPQGLPGSEAGAQGAAALRVRARAAEEHREQPAEAGGAWPRACGADQVAAEGRAGARARARHRRRGVAAGRRLVRRAAVHGGGEPSPDSGAACAPVSGR